MVLRTVSEMALDLPGTDERRSPTRLVLAVGMRDAIITHLRSALPNEGCGLLAGSIGGDGFFSATRFFPGENVDQSPTRFTMAGEQVVNAFREMRKTGLDLGAIVHSHPSSPAEPSPTDVRESYYPHSLALIVSFSTGQPEMRAWRWLPDGAARRYLECPVDLTGKD